MAPRNPPGPFRVEFDSRIRAKGYDLAGFLELSVRF